MKDAFDYRIEIRGIADEMDLNAGSPVALSVERVAADRTYLQAHTDQSGLIGAIRHLHYLGLVLLAVICTNESQVCVGFPEEKNIKPSWRMVDEEKSR